MSKEESDPSEPRSRHPYFALRAALLALALLALAFACARLLSPAAQARAPEGCEANARAWLRPCAQGSAQLAVESCSPGHVLLAARREGGVVLRIDVGEGQGFVRRGGLTMSPLGEFADWSEAPTEVRSAFDQVVACAERPRPAPEPPSPFESAPTPRPAGHPRPWLLALALACSLAALASSGASLRALLRARARAIGIAGALWLGAFALWPLLAPQGFFHQNGHGAEWVAMAFCEDSSYGPGYRELFHSLLVSSVAPEARLFLLQRAALALLPSCAWLLARLAGAPRMLALALAVALGCEPVLARLAGSESYFGTTATPLWLASLLLALASRPPLRRAAPWLLTLAASALLAQAARVHPIAWLPAATTPALVLALPGRARTRIARSVLLGVACALFVVVLTGPALTQVLRGEYMARWASHGRAGLAASAGPLVALLAPLALTLLPHRARGILTPVALLVGALVLRARTDLLSDSPLRFHRAYALLFAPVALVAFAALLRALAVHLRTARPRYALALALVALGVAHAVRSYDAVAPLALDAQESALALAWRDTLPPSARVYWLARADRRVQTLPLYAQCGLPHPRAQQQSVQGARLSVAPGPAARLYWVHSTLCEAPEAGSYCDDFESRHVLREVQRWVLPAPAETPPHEYRSRTLRGGLFLVEGARP